MEIAGKLCVCVHSPVCMCVRAFMLHLCNEVATHSFEQKTEQSIGLKSGLLFQKAFVKYLMKYL